MRHLLYAMAVLLIVAAAGAEAEEAESGPGSWEIGLELETVFSDTDGTDLELKPLIAYKRGGFSTHLALNTDDFLDGPIDESIEWETIYRLTCGFALKHEYDHALSSGEADAELTLLHFTDLGRGLSLGYELEIDYLKDDRFGLHRIEIEPTVKWKTDWNGGTFATELEFPVFQLYDRQKCEDDLKLVSAQLGVGYSRQLNDNTAWDIELKLPYDVVNHRTEVKLSFAVERAF